MSNSTGRRQAAAPLAREQLPESRLQMYLRAPHLPEHLPRLRPRKQRPERGRVLHLLSPLQLRNIRLARSWYARLTSGPFIARRSQARSLMSRWELRSRRRRSFA